MTKKVQSARCRALILPEADLAGKLRQRVVGQPQAVEAIVPCVQTYLAGLAPEGRPAGVFLLLGPTGTGKTRTVEALAELLHGSPRSLLRIDCAEYQMEHEVAKLIGAPPGYLGHRETQPLLSQSRINGVSSEGCSLSLVLFDEVEKAAPSLTRLLLGVLDKGTLRLGDNNTVSFEHCLVFMTSNVGADQIWRELKPGFGLGCGVPRETAATNQQVAQVADTALRRHFSPEFLNRLDAKLTYRPLDDEALSAILAQQLEGLQEHLDTRLGVDTFDVWLSPAVRQFLLARGTSPQYGARELKRIVQKMLLQPIAALVAEQRIRPGSTLRVNVAEGADEFSFAA